MNERSSSSGPYVSTSSAGESLQVTRNENYWGEVRALDSVPSAIPTPTQHRRFRPARLALSARAGRRALRASRGDAARPPSRQMVRRGHIAFQLER